MLINLLNAILIVWLLGMIPMFLVFKKIMTTGQEWESAGRYMKRHYIQNCMRAAAIWPFFIPFTLLSHLWDKERLE